MLIRRKPEQKRGICENAVFSLLNLRSRRLEVLNLYSLAATKEFAARTMENHEKPKSHEIYKFHLPVLGSLCRRRNLNPVSDV